MNKTEGFGAGHKKSQVNDLAVCLDGAGHGIRIRRD